jgi:hypothetical protein
VDAPPAIAVRVNVAGKTVIPALIDPHVHIGHGEYVSWGALNYTSRNGSIIFGGQRLGYSRHAVSCHQSA